jgi:hypothetical protein
MIARRLVFGSSLLAIAISSFTLGVIQSRRTDAATRAERLRRPARPVPVTSVGADGSPL